MSRADSSWFILALMSELGIAVPQARREREAQADPESLEQLGPGGAPNHGLVLLLQRSAGNAAVARALQRAPDPGAPPSPPPAAPGGVSTSTSRKVPISKDFPIKPPMPLGPIEFEGMEATGELEFEPPATSQAPAAPTGPSTDLKVSTVEGGGSSGPAVGEEVKLEHAFGERVLGYTPKLSGGSKITNQGIEIGAEFAFEGQNTAGALQFQILDWKAGQEPKVGVAKYESSGKWSAPAVEIPGWGVGKLTFTGKLAAVFQPNYKEIGEWLSEQLAKEVVVDLAFDASIALVGVATLVATWYEMAYAEAEGNDEMKAALKAKSDVLAFCHAYASVLQGFEANRAGAGAQGATAAEQILAKGEASTGTPRAALTAAAQKRGKEGHDFSLEVYDGVRSTARDSLKTKYESEHKVKSFLVHLAGQEGGGPLVSYFDQLVPADRMPAD